MLNKQQKFNMCCEMMKKYWHPYTNPYTVYRKMIPLKDFNNHLKDKEDIKILKINAYLYYLNKNK